MLKFTLCLGWGLLWENGDWPDDLQTVNVTSASPENCKGVEGVDVDETHLCVTPSHGHGICNRDSGGPLVYENELVGIGSSILHTLFLLEMKMIS